MVTQIVYNQEDRIGLVVEQAKETIPVCSGCGTAHVNAVHSIERVTVEDQPISGKKVFLYVTKRKVVCTEDKRIRVEDFDWLRKRYTKRFSDHVFRLTSITTNKEAGWFLGLDDEAVYRPEYADAYNNRGTLYGRSGKYQQAIDDFTKSIAINPQDANTYFNMGISYNGMGDLQQAIMTYTKAIELAPGHVAAYFNRGMSYAGLNRPTEAIRDFEEAIRLNPQYAKAYYNMGMVYSKMGGWNIS